MIRVAELFAGVGGFRLGLEGWKGMSASSGYSQEIPKKYSIVWSNQWEPSTKLQHASSVYEEKWGKDGHSNEDISQVAVSDIPDHDLLVGGFPCQDYSVARTLSQAAGLHGKKGVLWWDIHRILKEKGDNRPKYLFLENVDRLLKSPVKQRGRDFAIMLASLSDLGYAVEWRVINAADYGMPQRRRRIFFLGYHRSSPLYKELAKNPTGWMFENGVIADAFPTTHDWSGMEFPSHIDGDLVDITENFNLGQKLSPFENTGIMLDRVFWTFKTLPKYDGHRTLLRDILVSSDQVPDEFYLDERDIPKWEYLKGSKDEPRKRSDGVIFYYKEGPLSFPDHLDRPSRTIITSEGGKAASRFKHVVIPNGRLRRLVPTELERLNMFPDDHTVGAADTKRAFFMGNALVVGVIEQIGLSLANTIDQ